MAGFVARWLSESIRLGLSLAVALAAMQLPAISHAYMAALLQITESAHRDIAQRKEAARQYYHLRDDTDETVIAALRQSEPSNAEGMLASIEQARILRATYDGLATAPPLLQPVEAFADAVSDPRGDKRAVLQTAITTHVPQVVISSTAAVYGLVGLVLGALLAQIVLTLLAALARPWVRRQPARG
jgi:hypothetical protein